MTMQETAIKAGAPMANATGNQLPLPVPPAPAGKKRPRGPLYKALECVASLRITAFLFVLAFILVFYGTWAQVDAGIWTVVKQYFRSWYAFFPFKILLFRTVDIPVNYGIPYPGGWTIGALLLVNLLAAHAIRFKLTWKRSGIILLHAGIIVMMLGEFFTGKYAIEGHMPITEGYKANFVESDKFYELAFVDRSDPKSDYEIQVPISLLKEGKTTSDPALPFDVELVRYLQNSTIASAEPAESPATAGRGLHRVALPKRATTGVDQDMMDFPSAYVNLKDKTTGKSLGTYLTSTWLSYLGCQPDTVTIAGKTYQISLRPRRTYRDYTIALNKFEHKVFVGTDVAKDFRSFITLADPGTGENLKTEIYMNHPLRYRGQTFYQSGVPSLARGTILQVVRNFAWRLPYIACAMVAVGMLIHFGIMLVNFITKQGIGILEGG